VADRRDGSPRRKFNPLADEAEALGYLHDDLWKGGRERESLIRAAELGAQFGDLWVARHGFEAEYNKEIERQAATGVVSAVTIARHHPPVDQLLAEDYITVAESGSDDDGPCETASAPSLTNVPPFGGMGGWARYIVGAPHPHDALSVGPPDFPLEKAPPVDLASADPREPLLWPRAQRVAHAVLAQLRDPNHIKFWKATVSHATEIGEVEARLIEVCADLQRALERLAWKFTQDLGIGATLRTGRPYLALGATVIVAARLLGLDPTGPAEMTALSVLVGLAQLDEGRSRTRNPSEEADLDDQLEKSFGRWSERLRLLAPLDL
jgi:hypothetical protein